MGVSKVEFGGETLVDLTGDTVSPQNLLSGETAHGADGELVEGAVVAVPTTTSLAVTEEGVSALDGTVGKLLNDKFGGCTFEQEGNDFYIVGADAVRKKLGDIRQKISDYKKSSNVSSAPEYIKYGLFMCGKSTYEQAIPDFTYPVNVTKLYEYSYGLNSVRTRVEVVELSNIQKGTRFSNISGTLCYIQS